MKTLIPFLLVAAYFVACARGFPSIGYDSPEEDDDVETMAFDFPTSNFFSDTINRIRQHFNNYFRNIPDITNMKVPDGANTTSTTKIINGHVVTINETTYTSGDALNGAAFRIRVIDIKPQNDTLTVDGGNAEPTTVKLEPTESRETVEEFNNEIPSNTDRLTA